MDRSLRASERLALPGDEESAARLLTERIRAGELSLEQVRWAAYLGDGASQRALDQALPPPPSDPAAWIDGLEDLGHETCVRAALALGSQIAPACSDAALASATVAQIRAWVAAHPGSNANEEWRDSSCAHHARNAFALGSRLAAELVDRLQLDVVAPDFSQFVRSDWADLCLVELAQGTGLRKRAVMILSPDAEGVGFLGRSVEPFLQVESEQILRSSVCASLVPWLLGNCKPQ